MQKSHKPVISGVLVIDKPRGPTSMSMVNLVRRRSGGVKTGHAGTLDPLATGVLVLGLGTMTKQLGTLTATNKRYTTVIDLSAITAGHDEESPREEVQIDISPNRVEIEKTLDTFRGTILQTPPIFSAVKVQGRRAYTAARKGEEVVLEPRPVEVFAVALLEYAWPLATVDITCAKGFYVRSFARDLGKKLGTGGYCRAITRTEVGPFAIEQAHQLEKLPEEITQDLLISKQEVDRLLGLADASNRPSINPTQ